MKCQCVVSVAIALALWACTATVARAADSRPVTASITVPIKVSLERLRLRLEEDPSLNRFSLDRPEQTCIKERWISVSCVVTGQAERAGPVQLSGSGNQIRLQLPIRARLTAKTTSGLKARTTANGVVVLDVQATVGIQRDWQAALDLVVAYHWQKPPTLKLLNLIKIPLRSYVDPLLDKEVLKLQARAPQLAAELGLRADAQRAWQDLQRIHTVAGERPLSFRFNPSAVFFSGFEVADGYLRAALTVQGAPVLSTAKLSPLKPSPLPVLQQAKSEHTGVAFAADIRLGFDRLQAEMAGFERAHVLKDGATLELDAIHLSQSQGQLSLSVEARVDKRPRWLSFIDVFDWFVQEGAFELRATPRINSDAESLELHESSVRLLRGDLETSLFESFVIGKLEARLSERLSYQYADSLTKFKQRLNRQLGSLGRVGEFALSGQVDHVALESLEVQPEGLGLHLRLLGDLELSL